MKRTTKMLSVLIFAMLLVLGACDLIDNSDKTDPAIQINSPTNYFSWVTTDATLDIAGVAHDDKNIKSVKVTINGTNSVTANGTSNWSQKDISLQMGENVIVCEAKDKGGNTAKDTLLVTRNTDVNFIGIPFFSMDSFFIDEAGTTTVRQTINSSAQNISSVKLVSLNPDYSVAAEKGVLYDNGNLNNNDELMGDGVFSGKIDILEATLGTHYYRIVAYSDASIANYSPIYKLNFLAPIPISALNNIVSYYDQIEGILNQSTATSLSEGAPVLRNWFAAQDDVTSATLVDGALEITYTSGITSSVIFSETDENGLITTKGGSLSTERHRSPAVPLDKQTRGTNFHPSIRPSFVWNSPKEDNYDVIMDKDVLIWAPYEGVFNVSMRPTLEAIFAESDLDLNVVTLTNQQCSVHSLDNLADYGTIIFDTHGLGGEYIFTGEPVNAAHNNAHRLLFASKKLSISANVVFHRGDGYAMKSPMYIVRSAYIASIFGTLPNSVVFNGSCESAQTDNLADAFIGKGAKAYLGFNNVVNTGFCSAKSNEFFHRMAVGLKNNGQAFTAGQTDPVDPYATFIMTYSTNKLHYSYDLINGDFEMGNLSGWTGGGDGRVITQLADITPTQGGFMGIISTGLGYTQTSGNIAQSFKVPESASNLTIKWNFMSEEFMEFVGSEFQDFLTFALVDSTGSEHVLFHETIDSFVDYGLTHMSPPLYFDHGDVYGTDWRTFMTNIVAYRGQLVRLIIRIGDVGDSVYDSVCLLDDIRIY